MNASSGEALHSRLIAATLSAGVLAGLGAVGFHYIADYLDDVLFTRADSQRAISRLPFVLSVPTSGPHGWKMANTRRNGSLSSGADRLLIGPSGA